MNNTTFRVLSTGDPQSGLLPSNMTPIGAFTSDNTTELNHTFFQTSDESILSGTWECAPCIENFESYPVHEMMTVLSGSVTMTNASGQSETFTSGDVFFIPKGTKCTWEITETLRKIYMIAT
ncbi:MAG: putative cupin superfamily protein [Granulosicoccus sp.]|jgi:uncharacterized cupin superfamily protein